jgi:hypothetical protein
MCVAFAEEVDAAFDQNKSISFEHQARYGINVLDKTWAADLYLIYKLEPKARVCISDTDRMRMFYRT